MLGLLGKNSAAAVGVRIDDLTACRAVFAGWVFLYHLNLHLDAHSFGPLSPLVERGYLGVDGFFVLSGLVLAYAHPGLTCGPAEMGRFWAKRLLRLYPVHLAMIGLLAVMLAAGFAAGLPPRDPGRFGLGELARHLLLVHGWGLSGRWAWNYPSWSISTEWAGYLAFPLLWLGLRRMSPGACLAGAIAMLGMLAVVDIRSGAVGLNLTYEGALGRFFPEFIAGMAALRIAELAERQVSGPALAAAGAGLAICALWLARDWAVVAGLWLVLAGMLVAVRQGRGATLGRIPGMLWLGAVSYSFYMSFAVVETGQALIWRRLGLAPADWPVAYVVETTALTLALATLAWRSVERPALRLGRHLAVRRPAV
ncbi:MAG: acyltransferase [Alphaproteobacteria bacterium]|nr:acyltransferase [Alphaproteobacteria bacterium]